MIQIKSEEWNGEWVDIEDEAPDKSVLKVIVEEHDVAYYNFFLTFVDDFIFSVFLQPCERLTEHEPSKKCLTMLYFNCCTLTPQ